MADMAKAIRILEGNYKSFVLRHNGELMTVNELLALLKAQEPIEARLNLCDSCTKEYAECEAGKADLVYGNGVGNDNIIGCPWYVNRWKAQEPVKPTEPDEDNMRYCGACGSPVGYEALEAPGIEYVQYNYCPECGRAVRWT